MKRYRLLVLHIASLALLAPGWILDMLRINISTHFLIDLDLFNENRSVLGTLQKLWQSSNYWPFLLIFLFGIIVPLVKPAVIFYLLLAPSPGSQWYTFVNAISKWAMADVFAISIFVAFLGGNAMKNTTAELQAGFYYFSGYVLLSAVIAFVLTKMPRNAQTSNP